VSVLNEVVEIPLAHSDIKDHNLRWLKSFTEYKNKTETSLSFHEFCKLTEMMVYSSAGAPKIVVSTSEDTLESDETGMNSPKRLSHHSLQFFARVGTHGEKVPLPIAAIKDSIVKLLGNYESVHLFWSPKQEKI
jgi:hypothetical protein